MWQARAICFMMNVDLSDDCQRRKRRNICHQSTPPFGSERIEIAGALKRRSEKRSQSSVLLVSKQSSRDKLFSDSLQASCQVKKVRRKVLKNSWKIIFRGHRSDRKLCCAIQTSDPNKNELCASFCRRFNVSLKFSWRTRMSFRGAASFCGGWVRKQSSLRNPESTQRIIKKFWSEMFSQRKHKNLNPKMFEVTSKQDQWRLEMKIRRICFEVKMMKWKKNVKRRNFARVRFYVCC